MTNDLAGIWKTEDNKSTLEFFPSGADEYKLYIDNSENITLAFVTFLKNGHAVVTLILDHDRTDTILELAEDQNSLILDGKRFQRS